MKLVNFNLVHMVKAKRYLRDLGQGDLLLSVQQTSSNLDSNILSSYLLHGNHGNGQSCAIGLGNKHLSHGFHGLSS